MVFLQQCVFWDKRKRRMTLAFVVDVYQNIARLFQTSHDLAKCHITLALVASCCLAKLPVTLCRFLGMTLASVVDVYRLANAKVMWHLAKSCNV